MVINKEAITFKKLRNNDSYFKQYHYGAVFSYKLRYIVGFGLVEMAISPNPKPTIYRNLYENTGPVPLWTKVKN